jgi:hypothetical protein
MDDTRHQINFCKHGHSTGMMLNAIIQEVCVILHGVVCLDLSLIVLCLMHADMDGLILSQGLPLLAHTHVEIVCQLLS